MATLLDKIKNVDTSTKYYVAGYIRQNHQLLKMSPYALFQNIPLTISSLCTLYVYTSDHWELTAKGTPLQGKKDIIYGVSTSNNKKTLNFLRSPYSVEKSINYGSWIIPSTSNCIYQWTLQFEKEPNWTGNNQCIGICSKPWKVNNNILGPYRNKKLENKFYLFDINWSTLRSHTINNFESTKINKWKFNTGELFLELNLKQQSLSIYKKKQKKEVLFDDIEVGKDIVYRLAFAVYAKELDFGITIKNFTFH